MQLFGLEGGAVDPPVPATLQVARLAAPIVVALAAVQAIVAIFREQFTRLRVRLMRDHAVVCGLGARGVLLATECKRRRHAVGAALTQHARLRERDPDGGAHVPIVLHTREYAGVATLLDERGGAPGATPEWDLLSEGLKESNRRQAEHARTKLLAAGYDLRPLDGGGVEQVRLFSEAEVERMAIMEHDRWVAERVFEGWVPGPEKDEQRRISPYLVSWEELPGVAPDEDVQDWDRVAVRRLPSFLARAGFQVDRPDEGGARDDGA